MSDLISRSEVLSFIQKIKDEINENKCFGDKSRKLNMGDLQDIILFVENVSTAYSVDKVVEELKCDRCESCNFLEVCAGSEYCEKCHEKVIEIVKHGGVRKDVD